MMIQKRPPWWIQYNSGPATLCIPQELVDLIVDHLRDDPASLRASSTICSSFLPRSSVYILRTLRLRTTQLIPFLSSLSVSRRLQRFVVEFHIVDDEARVLTPNAIYNTILLLPNLHTLAFEGPFRLFSSSTVLPPSPARRPLRCLRFEFLHVDLVESVLELFKRVDDLHVGGRYIDGALGAPRIAGAVARLHVRLDATDLCALLRLFRPSALTAVALDCAAGRTVLAHDLDHFLQIYGPGLETLALALPSAGIEPLRSLPHLRACARLQELRLALPARRLAAALLPSVPPQLRRLHLEFREPPHRVHAHAQAYEWDRVGAALAHCEQLETLELQLTAPPDRVLLPPDRLLLPPGRVLLPLSRALRLLRGGALPQPANPPPQPPQPESAAFQHPDEIRSRLPPRLRQIVQFVG